MPLTTTVVGSYPKPTYLTLPDWFKHSPRGYSPAFTTEYHKTNNDKTEVESLIKKAKLEILKEQEDLGIDVVTDGEIARENYIYYFCRILKGFDFNKVVRKTYRNGAAEGNLPTISGKIELEDENCKLMAKEWQETQHLTEKPLKVTIPGPTTIIGTVNNEYYEDRRIMSADLVKAINRQIKCFADIGVKYVQLDEPVLVREPDIAMEYGIDHAAECFKGVPSSVVKVVHLCCGYPSRLDQEDYVKADKDVYFKLAEKMDGAGFDEISIEDAHCYNDLSLLAKFKKSKIILGSIKIASSRVESTEAIRSRLREALKYIPAERLVVAPDCGLGFLPRDILRQKLRNMVAAAHSLP